MNFLPSELESIIGDFKTDMETYEQQYQKIDELFQSTEDCKSIKVNIAYIDLREYLFRKNITHLKFQIALYEKGHQKNYKLWDLDLIRDDETMLEDYNIDEIVYSAYSNTLCLKFDVEEQEETTMDIDDDEEEDNNYLIDTDDDESDIELWMSLV